MGDLLNTIGKGLKSAVMGAKHMRELEKQENEQARLDDLLANFESMNSSANKGDTKSAGQALSKMMAGATDLNELKSIVTIGTTLEKTVRERKEKEFSERLKSGLVGQTPADVDNIGGRDFTVDPIKGAVGEARTALESEFQPKSFKMGDVIYERKPQTTEEKVADKQAMADVEIETAWKKEITKNKKTAMENFSVVQGLSQQLVGVWKAAAIEKGAKKIPKGLLSKVMSGVADKFELEGYPMSKAYMGQVIETGLALNKIITGYNRVIKDVFNRVLKTIPTDTGIVEDMEAKITQTIRNSFARSVGRELSKEEIAHIDSKIRNTLNTPPMTVPTGKPQGQVFKNFQIGGENYSIPIEEVPAFVNDKAFDDMEIFSLD